MISRVVRILISGLIPMPVSCHGRGPLGHLGGTHGHVSPALVETYGLGSNPKSLRSGLDEGRIRTAAAYLSSLVIGLTKRSNKAFNREGQVTPLDIDAPTTTT